MQYPAPGDSQLATRIVGMLKAAGLSAQEDDTWGLDHGSWIPLTLMYPKADIPVLQVSITKDFDANKVSCAIYAFISLHQKRHFIIAFLLCVKHSLAR